MPSSTHKSSKSRTAAKSRRSESDLDTSRPQRGKSTDAIDLLKADHEQVAEWFGQFETARSDEAKETLAQKICAALTVHAAIEEEIFYPAFLDATGEADLHHEAEIEHQGAKILIAQIEESNAEDEYFDARVTVLAELVRHHVNEEEQADGMFAKARESDLDLESLGDQLQARKEEMTDEMPSQRRAG